MMSAAAGVASVKAMAELPFRFYAARSSAAPKVSGSTLPPETMTATVLPRQSYLPAIAAARAVAPAGLGDQLEVHQREAHGARHLVVAHHQPARQEVAG